MCVLSYIPNILYSIHSTFHVGLVHITMPLLDTTSQSAEELLKPYLDAILSLTSPTSNNHSQISKPLFTLFYLEQPPTTSTLTASALSAEPDGRVFYVPSSIPSHHMSEIADSATTVAEELYWKSVQRLESLGKKAKGEEGESEGAEETKRMWPPLVVDAGDDDMVDY